MRNIKLFVMPLFISLVLVATVLCGAILAGAAGTPEPGSSSDPLVTRSYVDTQIQNLFNSKNSSWQVADLQPGEVFECSAGTEMILRAGSAAVVDDTGSGIANVTVGNNLTSGKAVPLNHLLIVPRTDGRGLKALGNATVMYKGEAIIR